MLNRKTIFKVTFTDPDFEKEFEVGSTEELFNILIEYGTVVRVAKIEVDKKATESKVRSELVSSILNFLRDCENDKLSIAVCGIISALPSLYDVDDYCLETKLTSIRTGALEDVYALLTEINNLGGKS